MDEWDFPIEDEAPASETPVAAGTDWVQRLISRLGNVRIHDTAQAGELASRLGARAFTVGRDVYLRPDLMRPSNAQSISLLAHELFHVAEQTGAAPPALDMPLLQPGRAVSTGTSSPRAAARGMAVQRAADTAASTPASQSGSEIAAEAIESAVVRQNVAETSGRQRSGQEPPDPQDIADKVYRLMVQELMLDRERAAGGWS
jgi:hypothetical protein